MTVCTTSFGFNGITGVIMNYFENIENSNVLMDFVVINDVDEGLKERIRIKSEKLSSPSKIFKIQGRNKNPFGYIKTLTRILKEGQYDIIHVHGNSATMLTELIAAKKAKVKVRIVHSHNTTCTHKVIHNLAKRKFHKSYTHGFACGKMAGKWLFEDRKFQVINNGVNTSKFKFNKAVRENARKEFGLTDKKVIGHIGHFSYQKNHEYVLKLFSKILKMDSTYQLVLLGDGKLKEEMVNYAKELGISDNVSFIGRTHRVVEYMHAFDMLILPSRFEGLPLTIIEAVSNALPCIISDNVSKEAIIEGFVKSISLDDMGKWIDEITTIDFSKREENSDKAIVVVKEKGYDIKDNSVRLLKLYKQFIEG